MCSLPEEGPNVRLMAGTSRPGSPTPRQAATTPASRSPQDKDCPQGGPGWWPLCPAERIQQSPGETAAAGSGSGVIRAVSFVVYTKTKESHKDATEAGA